MSLTVIEVLKSFGWGMAGGLIVSIPFGLAIYFRWRRHNRRRREAAAWRRYS